MNSNRDALLIRCASVGRSGNTIMLVLIQVMGLMLPIALPVELWAMQGTRGETPDFRQHGANRVDMPPVQADRDQAGTIEILTSSAVVDRQRQIAARLAQCNRCHGSDMHMDNSYLPVLQGQNLDYLVAKIRYFRQDSSSFHPMRGITLSLSDEQVLAISRYYASQPSRLRESLLISALAEPVSRSTGHVEHTDCAACHGRDGNGDSLIPAISGQNENYLSYRIREIADNDSRVHRHSVAPVNCQIPQVNLADSKRMARQLAMVLETERVDRGEPIYRQKCSACHDGGEQGAPKLSDKQDWSTRIKQGTRELVRSTVISKRRMSPWGRSPHLSRNELKDAIHYMLYQVTRSGQ